MKIQIITSALLISAALATPAFAQFSSGSDGSDGALSFAGQTGTVNFEPRTLGIDTDGDNVFHFTTIDIPAGVTVTLRASTAGLSAGVPVIWLASGDVTIAGTVSLDGATGHAGGATPVPSVPGAGGFAGGRGATSGQAPQAGDGPGGGSACRAGYSRGGFAAHAFVPEFVDSRFWPGPWVTYGTPFLFPLLGGSGGGGGCVSGTTVGSGGGAGGGAILVASSTRIEMSGGINAMGARGISESGGGGSGGAVRLMAPTLSGSGTVDVRAGARTVGTFQVLGGAGRVRFEGFSIASTLTARPVNSLATSSPGSVFAPASAPTVRVTSVGGIAVSASPGASFVMPDAVINSPTPVVFNLAATNIPTGTQPTLRLVAEDGTSITIQANALTGTLAASTASTPQVTIPSGFTRVFVSASW